MIMKIILLLLLTIACTDRHADPAEDYVLIEFASKLEEDYQKLNLKESEKKIVPKD